MIEAIIDWTRGPLFLLTFSFLLLGLIREFFFVIWSGRKIMSRAGDKQLGRRRIIRLTLHWLLPFRQAGGKTFFVITSVLFHLSILIVPLFLAGHIALWSRGLGVSWPAIPHTLADVLTLLAIGCALLLMLLRASSKSTRDTSQLVDFAILGAVILPFVTGFLLMHPAYHFVSYPFILLSHILSSEFLFVLIPLSRLRHAVLYPALQFVSELGWHWPSDAPSKVGLALHRKGV